MKTLATAIGLALVAVSTWGMFGLTRHAIEALDAIKDTARQTQPAIQNVTAVTEDVRKTSAQQAQSLLAIERDVRIEMWDLNRTLLSTRGAITEAQGAIGDARVTLTHVNGTADAATEALGSVKREADSLVTLTDASSGLVTRSSGTVDDLDALLKSKAIQDLPMQTDRVVFNFADMLETANQVEQHYAYPILHPSKNPFKRAWSNVNPFLVAGAKVAATLF